MSSRFLVLLLLLCASVRLFAETGHYYQNGWYYPRQVVQPVYLEKNQKKEIEGYPNLYISKTGKPAGMFALNEKGLIEQLKFDDKTVFKFESGAAAMPLLTLQSLHRFYTDWSNDEQRTEKEKSTMQARLEKVPPYLLRLKPAEGKRGIYSDDEKLYTKLEDGTYTELKPVPGLDRLFRDERGGVWGMLTNGGIGKLTLPADGLVSAENGSVPHETALQLGQYARQQRDAGKLTPEGLKNYGRLLWYMDLTDAGNGVKTRPLGSWVTFQEKFRKDDQHPWEWRTASRFVMFGPPDSDGVVRKSFIANAKFDKEGNTTVDIPGFSEHTFSTEALFNPKKGHATVSDLVARGITTGHTDLEVRALDKINAFRKAHQQPAVQLDANLHSAAKANSDIQARANYGVGHYASNNNEIAFKAGGTPEAIVQGWYDSASDDVVIGGHRGIMVNGAHTKVGISLVGDGSWSAVFQ